MNYLTNYYKNLCEDLTRKLNLLENQLHEMQAQISADAPEAALTSEPVSAMIPPSSAPQTNSPTAPTDPGDEPKRRDGETDESFGQRYSEWLKAKKRWEAYQRWRKIEERGGTVFSYPERMPSEKKKVEGETVTYALPPARPGDIYIGQNGQVYRVNENNQWVPV